MKSSHNPPAELSNGYTGHSEADRSSSEDREELAGKEEKEKETDTSQEAQIDNEVVLVGQVITAGHHKVNFVQHLSLSISIRFHPIKFSWLLLNTLNGHKYSCESPAPKVHAWMRSIALLLNCQTFNLISGTILSTKSFQVELIHSPLQFLLCDLKDYVVVAWRTNYCGVLKWLPTLSWWYADLATPFVFDDLGVATSIYFCSHLQGGKLLNLSFLLPRSLLTDASHFQPINLLLSSSTSFREHASSSSYPVVLRHWNGVQSS